MARISRPHRPRQYLAPAPAALLPRVEPRVEPRRKRLGLPPRQQAPITVYDSYDSYDDIVTAGCSAWNFFANNTKVIASITARSWAEVSQQGRWYKQFASAAAAGIFPMGSRPRRLMNPSTLSMVAYSTAVKLRDLPRRWKTSSRGPRPLMGLRKPWNG